MAISIELIAPVSSRATGVQMHLAQTAVRRSADVETVSAVLEIVGGLRPGASCDRNLIASLAIASALAMHRGFFAPKEFASAAKSVAMTSGGEGLTTDSLKRALVRLCRSGIAPSSGGLSRRLTFHEGFAELCIDRLSTRPDFLGAFRTAARHRLNDDACDGPVEKWLIAVELNDAKAAVERFDTAASAGAYARMAHCLDRLARRTELDDLMRVQRAILLDRTGRFERARAAFASLDARSLLRSEPFLGAMLLAGRIEATHDATAVDDALLLAQHANPLIAAAGMYWELHIAAHHGSFAASRLCELASAVEASSQAGPSHWRHYTALRMYVDSLRHLYLSGTATLAELKIPDRQTTSRLLRRELAITDAFDTLYTRAHFIGHVLLPRLAIYSVPPTEEEAEHVGLGDERRDVEALIEAATHEYSRARAQFALYGDREAQYLQVDEINLQMIREDADLTAARMSLDRYQSFIVDAGFADLASYPHLYLFRWHLLSYSDAFVHGGPILAAEADRHLGAAEQELLLVSELDAAVSNSYGVFRASFLLELLHLLRKPVDAEWMSSVERQSRARGYGIEANLANHLARRPEMRQTDVLRLLKFYPLVHQ